MAGLPARPPAACCGVADAAEPWSASLWENPALPPEGAGLERLPEAQGLAVFRTSGSQGEPKFVGLSRQAMEVSARAVNRFLGCGPGDRWLRALPLFHVGGHAIPLRAALAGADVVSMEGRWQSEAFWSTCRSRKVTLSSLVPAQVHDLWRGGWEAPPALRAVLVGGGWLDSAVWHEMRARGWPLLPTYGLTEAASQVATLAPAASAPEWLEVLPHWETSLTAEGLLALRGPSLFTCTFHRSGSAAGGWEVRPAPEWLVTSDRVELREGRLRFLGRADELVKIRGELVDVAQVRRRLEQLAREEGWEAAVTLRTASDPRAGVRLLMEHEPAVPARRLLERLNAAQPAYARVEAVEVPRIRRSALGKPLAPPSG